MGTVILVALLLLGALYFINKYSEGRIYKISHSEDRLTKVLLGWVVFGFLSLLDNPIGMNCVFTLDLVFEPKNLLYTSVSIILLFWASKITRLKYKRILFLSEFSFWLVKLLLLKGGYEVDFDIFPEPTIIIYNLIGVFLRITIIFHLFHIDSGVGKAAVLAMLLVGIKVHFFPISLAEHLQGKQLTKARTEIHQALIGKWVGSFFDKGMKASLLPIVMVFDSSSVSIQQKKANKVNYRLFFHSGTAASLSRENEEGDFVTAFLTINKLTADSLMLQINSIELDGELILIRE